MIDKSTFPIEAMVWGKQKGAGLPPAPFRTDATRTHDEEGKVMNCEGSYSVSFVPGGELSGAA